MPSFLIVPLLALISGQPTQYEPTYPLEAAIIQDADGYTNVRADENGRSAIVDKVHTNEVFLFDTEAYNQQQEWIRVDVQESRFSLALPIGYMHRSRIRPVGSLPTCRKPELVYERTVAPFHPKAHRIKRDGNCQVATIDGLGPWGVDCSMPKTETTKLRITIAGQPVSISARLYHNLYNGSTEFKAFKNGGTYFIVQHNSDGAGSYDLIWVLRKSGLMQRIVDYGC